jgi:hypothetical protein
MLEGHFLTVTRNLPEKQLDSRKRKPVAIRRDLLCTVL